MAEGRSDNDQKADEGEDDYMADLSLFLPPQTAAPPLPVSSKKVSTVKVQNFGPQKKIPKTLNWQEQRRLKRELQQEAEDKKTLSSTESAIPQSNIGFKLLKQMGYTPGSALGKEGSGIVEPVGLQIRRSRAGIGREDPRKEKRRREEEKLEREKKNVEELIVDFGSRQKEQWRIRKTVVNYHKAKAALEQLENKEVVVEEKNDEVEGENEEEEEEITEEDLIEILMKLREDYQYCLFCGCRYESTESLLSNCPGRDDDDH